MAIKESASYRSTYDAIWKDLDFRRLSPVAKSVFFLLKSELGRYGIDVCYTDAFHRQINCATTEIASALEELEQAKPGKVHGWIVREEHMIWLVNGLQFEPSITLGNPNHWHGANKFADELPNLPIVQRFMSHYGLDGIPPEAEKKPPKPSKTGDTQPPTYGMGDGIGDGIPQGIGDHRDGNRDGYGYGYGNRERDGNRDEGALPDSVTPIDGLPAAAAALVARFYGTAPDKRRNEVIAQLRATVAPNSPGARLSKGVRVRAKDVAHLERICCNVMADPPDKHDVAVVWVLRKLGDLVLDDRGRTPGEANADREKAQRVHEDAYFAAKRAAAAEWAKANPEATTALEERSRHDFPATDFGDVGRKAWMVEQIATKIDFPDFDTWAAARTASRLAK